MKTTIKNITILSALVASLFTFNVNAQSEKQIKVLERHALKAFKKQDYKNALAMYLQLDNMAKDQVRYDYMIGMCYLSSETPEKALPYLRTGKDHPSTSWIVNYYLGRAYFTEGNYIEAGNYLADYKEGLVELLDAGYRFKKVDLSRIPETNRIHFEKTLDDINKLLAVCQIRSQEQLGLTVSK
ncbi:MAG: hypothetical protein SFY32_04785 [Bacteroidota bacterium]|nr:hypothetical protein [Bacteroidota bacterium]